MHDSFYEILIPEELRHVANRHQQHVAELVSRLQSVGLDDQLIDRSVDQLIASYKAELIEAIRALKGYSHA